MTFNSITYAFFLPIVFIFYWYLLGKRHKAQNLLLLASSYVFYGWWDWRFLGLILFTTLTTFYTGIKIFSSGNKKRWLVLNIVLNLSILFTFKYLNFFAENVQILFNSIGLTADFLTLNIILPIGISFYILQAISYSIDVYRKKINATRDYIAFSTYIAFFPQLVAGPIERSVNLLPQILNPRQWNYATAVNGMRQILWGLFKKVAVADLCGVYVNRILSDPDYYNGSTILLALLLFCFQIYGDFSGYSDIAIGSAKLFGIRLSTNFRYPYFASTISEYWRRWHISLMTWLRDYVYFPLGGSRGSKIRTYTNIVIVFFISGIWHGASWTYFLWGAFWAVTFIAERMIYGKKEYRFNIWGYIVTMFVAFLSFIIFRSPSVAEIGTIVSNIFTPALLSMPTGLTPLFTISIMITIEFIYRYKDSPLLDLQLPATARWALYTFLIYAIVFAVDESSAEFIYFQF